jgi:SAM-dependent methyltransferase
MPDRAYDAPFATYYDRLTSHKDYEAEVRRLVRLVRETAPEPQPRILDVGCGTGTHAALLAEEDFDVTAVEPSPEMAKQAEAKASPTLKVVCGDIADLDDADFPFCVSLFNVINCLESLEGLVAFFGEISARLAAGAVFLAESWNSVAVIAAPPVTVERTYEDETQRIRRTVVPDPDFLHQRLDLQYQVVVSRADRDRDDATRFDVTQRLVLFTPLEIEFALRRAGFGNIRVRTALPDLAAATATDRMLAFTCNKTEAPSGL